MSQESGIEKTKLEQELTKVEPETSEKSSTFVDSGHIDSSPSSPTRPETASATEIGVAADDGQWAITEEIFTDRHRGRYGSRSTDSSNESRRTLSDTGDEGQVPPDRDRSRDQSSIRSVRPQPEVVPRGKRRGIFARFTVVAEVTNAWDYPNRTKWFLTFIIAVAGAAAPMATSIILPALVDIARDFNSTATVVNLSIALYMLSMSIFPLWWSSFSETLGRRNIYLTSFALYIVFSIIATISNSVGMFVTMRLLSGGAAASVQAVGAGTIADIWEVKERGKAMGMFYLGPLMGPLLAPIIGGALAQGLGWRSCQWFLVIMGGIILVVVLFCLPETLKVRKSLATVAVEEPAPQIAAAEAAEKEAIPGAVRPTLSRTTTKQSVHLQTKRYAAVLRRCFIDPLRIILYLQFPAVAILVAYASVTFASLYMLNISIQQTFSIAPYGYKPLVIGLLYLPNSFGYFLTSIFGGRWVDTIMHREARKAGRYDAKHRLQFRPEDRMKENAWCGAISFPLALIVYGWTVQYGVSVAASLVANFFFGVGSMLVFAMVTTMLTEFMPTKGSHGVALNNFVRNIFSCAGGVAADPLILAIGNGWMFTGLGIISLCTGVGAIWAMNKYSDHWRITMDKNMAKVAGD